MTGPGPVWQWIQAGQLPVDALMQVETMLNTREALSQGIVNIATLAIVLNQHITALQTRIAALEAHDNIIPDPGTVF